MLWKSQSQSVSPLAAFLWALNLSAHCSLWLLGGVWAQDMLAVWNEKSLGFFSFQRFRKPLKWILYDVDVGADGWLGGWGARTGVS